MKSLTHLLKSDSITRINTDELNEMEYWTYKWKISTFQLLDAMHETKSNIASKIEECLRGKKLI